MACFPNRIPQLVMIAILAFVEIGCGQKIATTTTTESLPEWETAFTYRSKPIHPALLFKFEGWMSDGGPIVVAVDVASADGTNEYAIPVEHQGEFISCALPKTDPQESFAYSWLGRMSDGTHVVRTVYNSGGTGRFETVYFCKFSVDDGYAVTEGERQQRILLNVTGWHLLGDRSNPSIEVGKDYVKIIPRPSGEDPFAANATPATLYPSKKTANVSNRPS